MSRLASKMPRTVGRSLATAPAALSRRPQTCIAALNAARCYSTGREFKGQMVQSIGERLAREKADLERMAAIREKQALGRNWALTFGAELRQSAFVGQDV